MADLIALAERVEKLGGPCRETDVEIARAVRWLPERVNPIAWDGRNYELAPSYWFKDGFGLPRYTASIDAAMTLCEPHWWINMSAPLSPDAYGYSRESQRRPRAGMECIGDPYSSGGNGATLPLAVSSMALRARASMTRTTGDGDGNNG